MKKDELVIYWAPAVHPKIHNTKDASFLYNKPETLFQNMAKDKIRGTGKSMSMFNCPAVANKTQRTLVFTSPMSLNFTYENNGTNIDIQYSSPASMDVSLARDPEMRSGPYLMFNMEWIFFAEEPVQAFFTPPYFHKPKYTQYGSLIPGEFDVGRWFRPYVAEMLMWNNSGDFILEENEPLFYVEFKTDKKIKFKQFNFTPEIRRYSQACVDSTVMFGFGQTLLNRYNRFGKIGLREKILKEIKKEIIE